jgi:hypothetical protein
VAVVRSDRNDDHACGWDSFIFHPLGGGACWRVILRRVAPKGSLSRQGLCCV